MFSHDMKYLCAILTLVFVAAIPASSQTMYSDDAGSLLGFGGAIAILDGDVFISSAPI